MVRRSLYIEEFNQFLHKWKGEHIKVSKEEIGDHDETIMQLLTIEYANNEQNINDYGADHLLKLRGPGHVKTVDPDPQPLPGSVYDIPLEDHTTYEVDDNMLTLTTERGIYTIERLSPYEINH